MLLDVIVSARTNIFLIGPMGAGKTTVGQRLALKLGKTFIDSDQEIVQLANRDIPSIFDAEGEVGFRKYECRVIQQLTQGRDIVLATGGGAVLSEANRKALADGGFVVYLQVTPQVLAMRLETAKNRPLLDSNLPLLEQIERILRERQSLYETLAECIIGTAQLSVEEIVDSIYYSHEQAGNV